MNEKQIERRDADGNYIRRAERTMLTDKGITAGDVRVPVSDGLAVYVGAGAWRSLTRAEKDALKATWRNEAAAMFAEPDEPVVSDDYDSFNVDDLRVQAQERGVSLRGMSRKEDIINALRAADISARFAPTPEVTEVGSAE